MACLLDVFEQLIPRSEYLLAHLAVQFFSFLQQTALWSAAALSQQPRDHSQHLAAFLVLFVLLLCLCSPLQFLVT